MPPTVPLLDPSGYFRRDDRPSLAIGAGLVAVLALANAILAVGLVFLLADQTTIPPGAGLLAGVAGLFAAALELFGRPIVWVVLSGIAHVFLMIWDAEGEITETLAVVGEAEMAGLVLFPVQAGLAAYLVVNAPTDPAAVSEVTSGQPFTVALSFATIVWKALIQGIGLGEVHGVSTAKTLTLTMALGLLVFSPGLLSLIL